MWGGVSIGNGTWVGANVTILKNTRIGENCVIGAGTVISGVIPDHSIVTGGRNIDIVPIKPRGTAVSGSEGQVTRQG